MNNENKFWGHAVETDKLREAITNATVEVFEIREILTNLDASDLDEETKQQLETIMGKCDCALNGIFDALGITADSIRRYLKEYLEAEAQK